MTGSAPNDPARALAEAIDASTEGIGPDLSPCHGQFPHSAMIYLTTCNDTKIHLVQVAWYTLVTSKFEQQRHTEGRPKVFCQAFCNEFHCRVHVDDTPTFATTETHTEGRPKDTGTDHLHHLRHVIGTSVPGLTRAGRVLSLHMAVLIP